MRIHYISPSMLPSRTANSVHVLRQCDGLCRIGARVSLYAGRTCAELGNLRETLREAYGIDNPALDLVTCHLSSSRGASPRIALRALGSLLRETSAARVLSRNLYAAFVLAVLRRMPLLYEVHDLETGFRKTMQRAIVGCPWVTTIAISQHLLEYLSTHLGVSPGRSIVLHDAAPEGLCPVPPAERRERLTARVPQARGNWRSVCGYFGHLYPGRGIEIIEAMAAKRPDCLFLVYGGTEADLGARCVANRQSNLAFMGHIPHPVAQEMMSIMDVLLMPYQESVSIGVSGRDTARWMSPMKMFEYMGAGVPVISSDLPVLREVLRDGENSLLVVPDDAEAWGGALEKLERDQQWAARIGIAAHEQYRREHTWTRRAERIIAALEQP